MVLMKNLLTLSLIGAAVFCHADYRYEFSPEKNPLEALNPSPQTVPLLGGKVSWKSGILKTGACHAVLFGPEEFRTGRVTLSAQDHYTSDIALIARARKDAGAFYMLEVSPSKKKINFSRFIYGETMKKEEFPYDGERNFTLSLDFNGKTIAAWVNGKKISEFPDDGRLKSGYAGVRCGFWTNAELKAFSYSAAIPQASAQTALPMKPASNVGRLDLAKLRNWDLSKAFRKVNGTRMIVSLNQFWAFQPVADADAPFRKEPSEWGYFAVPGYWAKGAVGNYMRIPSGEAVTEWRGIPFSTGGVGAWYRRTFRVPEEWRSRNVELVLEDVCGTAEIYLGTKKIAEKNDPFCGRICVNLSGELKPGTENELLIRSRSPRKRRSAGLGNIYLQIAPSFRFGDAAISTMVAEKRMDVTFRNAAVPEKSTLTAVVRDRSGKEIFRKQSAFSQKLSYAWMPPVLWTPDTPELYFLELTLRDHGGKMLDQTTYRFGFREFTVDNGRFFLNGKPVTLKAETAVRSKGAWWGLDFYNDPAMMKPLFASYKKLNLNCTYLPPSPSDDLLALADEMGIMVLVKGWSPSHSELDNDTENAMKRLEHAIQTMKNNPVYGRHPSQIGFLIDVWYGYNAGCTNPNYIGQPAQDPNRKSGIPALRGERLNRMAALYKNYFPELECFTGGSGAVGNIYGTHIYHTWGAPSTELRAIFEDWNRKREFPIFVGETFLPYIGSFFDLENFHGGGTPYVTENSARILGRDAYNYRTTVNARPFHERSSRGWFWNTTEAKNGGKYGFSVDPATAVTAKYIDEIMPGWRFHNLTGYGCFDYVEAAFAMQWLSPETLPISRDYSDLSFKPEAFDNFNARRPVTDPRAGDYDLRPTLISAPFARAMADVSAAIFDKAADPLLQNHSGYAGEILEKSVMLFNDSPNKVCFQLDVSLSDSQNRTVLVEKRSVEAAPFEHKRFPVRISLPQTGSRAEWVLNATLSGPKTIRMQFPIQVFARQANPQTASPVYLWDPEGILAGKLSKRLKFQPWDPATRLPERGILIVGRGALAQIAGMPDWNAAVANGLNILFMEQHPASSPELMKTRTRRTFINAPAHPVFDGLADADFEFWKDAHSVAPAKTKDGAGINWSDWGNRNMVASYAFRRPQHGNVLSLVVSGFDLFQTPLLECRLENGSWIASQMEITERLGVDPVATRLFDNLVRYLDRPTRRSRVLFFGGTKGKQFLEKFKVRFTPVDTLSGGSLKNADVLLISDPDWQRLKQVRMELNDFVYFGGRVFYLHAGGKFDPSWLPFTMELGEQSASRAALSGSADGVWLNGFHNSELYWRTPRKLSVFRNAPPQFDSSSPAVLLRGKFGSGEWIFTTLAPDLFGKTPAMGKTVRLLSALFTSLGAGIAESSVPFTASVRTQTIDLSEQKWEFAIDQKNTGLSEQWQFGKGGAHWLKGLIADGIEVRVGQPFETFLRYDYDGYVWYRLTFDAPDHLRNASECYFIAGAIDDTDEVYLNGVKIGATGKETPQYWSAPRCYRIPGGLLKSTGNLLAVRVFDEKGNGGITKGPVMISPEKLQTDPRLWKTPWPAGARHDYEYKADIVRMY